MKWFKHRCDLSRHPGVAAFTEACGRVDRLRGYGVMSMLLEIVAERMDTETDDPSACFSLSQWSHHLYCHHHAVTKFLNLMEQTGLVTLTKVEGNLKVTIPDLNEWADETTMRSRRERDKLRERRQEKSKKDKREGDLCTLPDDFVLTDERRQIAAQNCPSADVENCFEKFRAYYFGKKKSSTNWQENWRLWTLREKTSRQSNGGAFDNLSSAEKRRRALKMLAKDLRVPSQPGEPEVDYLKRVEVINNKRLADLEPRTVNFGSEPVWQSAER